MTDSSSAAGKRWVGYRLIRIYCLLELSPVHWVDLFSTCLLLRLAVLLAELESCVQSFVASRNQEIDLII
jgi:hypothetical protein